MIVTAEQAEAIEAGEPFVVNVGYEWTDEMTQYVELGVADQPCPTCNGSGEEANIYLGPTDHRCPTCHGTGRHVEELVTEWFGDDLDMRDSYGLFTIQVRPVFPVIAAVQDGWGRQYTIIATKVEP